MVELNLRELDSEKWDWIKLGLKIRAFEQSLLDAYGRGGIRGTVHTSLGQEMIAVVCAKKLRDSDLVFGTHRSHAYFLAITEDYLGLAREIYGREGAVSKGIGGSQHIKSNSLITNGIQGGMTPIAVGASFDSYLSDGNKHRSISVIGDGTLGTGILYEALNVASLFQTNTLFIVENNGIAQSTPQIQFLSGSIENRCRAFDIPYFQIDANNPLDLFSKFPELLGRGHSGPILLDISCFRLGPHSKGDDNRNDEYLLEIKSTDFLNRAMNSYAELSEYFQECLAGFQKELDQIAKEVPSKVVPIDYLSRISVLDSSIATDDEKASLTLRELTSKRIGFVLSHYPSSLLIGEDVYPYSITPSKPYSGAFGVSKDLTDEAKEKLKNFPISEAALAGFGLGRALRQMPTMIEIMFADFSTLIVDQIFQQASKIPSMYGELVKLPVLFRIPTGGRRGYGPTHSQNLEHLFFGLPNVVIYVASSLDASETVYADLLSIGMPVIAVEPKDLYNKQIVIKEMLGYELSPIATNMAKPLSYAPQMDASGTIFTYGNAFDLCQEALYELLIDKELVFDVFVARLIQPIDLSAVGESIARTRLLIIIEETNAGQGIASHLLAQLQHFVKIPFRTILIGGNGIIGASAHSENSALISKEFIYEKLEGISKP